jgi:hypothetical protein
VRSSLSPVARLPRLADSCSSYPRPSTERRCGAFPSFYAADARLTACGGAWGMPRVDHLRTLFNSDKTAGTGCCTHLLASGQLTDIIRVAGIGLLILIRYFPRLRQDHGFGLPVVRIIRARRHSISTKALRYNYRRLAESIRSGFLPYAVPLDRQHSRCRAHRVLQPQGSSGSYARCSLKAASAFDEQPGCAMKRVNAI